MLKVLKNLFRKEYRLYKRKKAEYIVACKSMDLDHTHSIFGSDEIITRTEYISEKGMSMHWPDNYKCHLCKHKIDVEKGTVCELEECKFDFSCFKIGSDINITLQIKGIMFENLKAKVVWHKEANRKEQSIGKMGISFYEPINFEF